LKFITKTLSISSNSIKGYFFNTQKDYKNNKFYKNKFLGFLLFLGFPFYMIFKLLKRNPKTLNFTNIGVEEWREDSYDLYYYKLKNIKRISINKNLKREVDILDFTDKQSLLKILKLYLNPKFIFFVLKEKNFFEIVKFLYAYHFFHTLAKYSNIKIYISANDLMAHLLKYEILSQYNIKYFVIESSLREKDYIKYKGADIIYCYGSQQAEFYKDKTNNFKIIKEIGSIKNDKFVNKNYQIKYDIIFIEQFGDASNSDKYSNESYIKVLENLIKLKKEYKDLNILYRTRAEKRKTKSHVKVFDEVFEKLEKSGIILNWEGNSYEKVMESKVVVGVFSTLCFESIGLNKPTLFFYYWDYPCSIYDFENSKDIVITDDSYEIFRDRILYYLNNPQNYDFKKYKKIYMNQVDDFFGMIQKDINNAYI